jgi:hypothetical protein
VYVTIGGDWIGHWIYFTTGLVTASNYNTIADLHVLKTTTADAKSFQSAMSSRVVPC